MVVDFLNVIHYPVFLFKTAFHSLNYWVGSVFALR
jgi:hypothetical protein